MSTLDTANVPAIACLAQALSDSTVTAMTDLAADQAARASRLTAVANRLTATLGAGNPRVAALASAAQTSTTIARNLGGLATRIARRPAANPAALTALGQVVDPQGAGVPGLYVRVSDEPGSLTLGARAATDQDGDFSLSLTPADIPAPAPPLFLIVEDSKGHRMAESSQAVTLQAGSPWYEQIVLGEQPPTTPPPGPPPTKKPPPKKKKGHREEEHEPEKEHHREEEHEPEKEHHREEEHEPEKEHHQESAPLRRSK